MKRKMLHRIAPVFVLVSVTFLLPQRVGASTVEPKGGYCTPTGTYTMRCCDFIFYAWLSCTDYTCDGPVTGPDPVICVENQN